MTHAQFAAFLNASGPVSAEGERFYDVDDADARIHLKARTPPEEITTTERGRTLSRGFRSGHHNIGFRCAR